jgi:hypothetical protein
VIQDRALVTHVHSDAQMVSNLSGDEEVSNKGVVGIDVSGMRQAQLVCHTHCAPVYVHASHTWYLYKYIQIKFFAFANNYLQICV